MGKSNTTVVNIHRGDEYDVYCGRPGKGEIGYFGNPHDKGTRTKNIADFKVYFYKRIAIDAEYKFKIHALKGKRLGCFCYPKACHLDIIVEYLDSLESNDLESLDGI